MTRSWAIACYLASGSTSGFSKVPICGGAPGFVVCARLAAETPLLFSVHCSGGPCGLLSIGQHIGRVGRPSTGGLHGLCRSCLRVLGRPLGECPGGGHSLVGLDSSEGVPGRWLEWCDERLLGGAPRPSSAHR